MAKSSDLYQHALAELRLKGLIGKGEPLPNSASGVVLRIVDLVSDQMVKGEVPQHIRDMIFRLTTFQPLSPLTGDDKEWCYLSPTSQFNKRCPRVIRDSNGQAWDTQAIMYQDWTGHRYFTPSSKQPITFPYLPTQFTEKVEKV